MERYRLFHVSTLKSKPGKGSEAVKWWHEKGQAFMESLPGVKSVNAYATQFNLGGEYQYEIWAEIEDYAVYDRWDEDTVAHPERYGPFFESSAYFDWGPARIMGDWPQSRLISREQTS